MPALSEDLRAFLVSHAVGALATSSPEGRPRQSLVYLARDGNSLLITTLAVRLKARDVARSGWASICVMEHEPPYPSATFSGAAEILTEIIGIPTAAIMHHSRRRAAGADDRRRARGARARDPGDHRRARQLGQLHHAGCVMTASDD